ncbi:restriction endonuclease subunit S [Enterococcus faecium]|uniref:restriction endonuclease subunit S n=1 Tax=Enterococcus sp. 10F3_DIV0382 TaxID=1834165 RepID=UPI000A32C4DA|nr:restriction endonuclease subunit S [Enterococcus sp. 10F3_DIV0382]EGP5197580.1 restriction endonuclease subunit S [Enterococcus faecium]EGP5312727.1 restriction endonuclease subunit S [Enterococcus faecium]EGP5331042.1 restriction endonuclease subunit S [Enterococcus faecium]EGP5480397.1 restriction endonuclease subunit S [Enterococcus faecium]EMC2434367.1 restriction endonuclease subunit S [Enterococcus faecium]
MSNDTQPEIRFPGFTEDWEERKIKDIFKITRGQVLAATETSEEKSDISPFPVYSSQTKNNGLMGYYKDYLFDTAITWTTDGANAGTVSYRSGRFYSTNVNGVLISDKGYTNKAISEILNLEAWKWVSHVGNPKLMNNVMGDISIMIPSSFEEQDRLSDFLNQLDDTIALHQRKLDLLKETKKGFLQKMFPKNGAKVPEIRFPGFTEDWEQRKVGDFLNESRIKGSDGSVARKMTVKLWRKGVVPKEEIYSGSSATQYYIRKSGQFMYGKLDFLNQAFGIVPSELDGYESTLDSPAFDIGENMNSIFLLEYVSLTRFYKYQGNLANGSRRAKRIHVDTFLEMPIPTPSFEEQTKIGGFFKQLDDTITLHQRKLDLLKETKKGFLQKMFV